MRMVFVTQIEKRPQFHWSGLASMTMIYDGELFADWAGDIFIGGLSSKAVVRVEVDGENAEEAARYEWDRRIREIEQGPDGALYVLEDTRNGEGGRLVKLTPRSVRVLITKLLQLRSELVCSAQVKCGAV